MGNILYTPPKRPFLLIRNESAEAFFDLPKYEKNLERELNIEGIGINILDLCHSLNTCCLPIFNILTKNGKNIYIDIDNYQKFPSSNISKISKTNLTKNNYRVILAYVYADIPPLFGPLMNISPSPNITEVYLIKVEKSQIIKVNRIKYSDSFPFKGNFNFDQKIMPFRPKPKQQQSPKPPQPKTTTKPTTKKKGSIISKKEAKKKQKLPS